MSTCFIRTQNNIWVMGNFCKSVLQARNTNVVKIIKYFLTKFTKINSLLVIPKFLVNNNYLITIINFFSKLIHFLKNYPRIKY